MVIALPLNDVVNAAKPQKSKMLAIGRVFFDDMSLEMGEARSIGHRLEVIVVIVLLQKTRSNRLAVELVAHGVSLIWDNEPVRIALNVFREASDLVIDLGVVGLPREDDGVIVRVKIQDEDDSVIEAQTVKSPLDDLCAVTLLDNVHSISLKPRCGYSHNQLIKITLIILD